MQQTYAKCGSELVPKAFSVEVSSTGVAISDQESDKSLYIVYPLVNESALVESIVTQFIHVLKCLY